MRSSAFLLLTSLALLASACGGSDAGTPGAPTGVGVAPGAAAGSAVVSFTAPADGGTSAVTGYTVTANPGGITASGPASPITVTGLAPRTAYTYSVVASNGAGGGAAATTGLLRFYDVVETFREPMTQPNDTIFTGSFTFDATSRTVSSLAGELTQAMTKVGAVYGPPMTKVSLGNQLSAVAASPGGVNGLLVTTFALATTNTFDPSGFTPGGTQYYGLSSGAPRPRTAGWETPTR
jgi:hypothetical protein